MIFPKLLSPTVTVRLFDPMPLPRKSAAVRRARIVLSRMAVAANGTDSAKKSALKGSLAKFTYKVKRIPMQA